MSAKWRYLVIGLLVTATATAAQAQYTAEGGIQPNPSYDGRYAFARLRYPGEGCMSEEGPGWHHDYPVAERNLMKILTNLTMLDAHADSTAVFTPDDPELTKYPIAYLSEAGCWELSDAEVVGLRAYLLKGGMLIVDDFREDDWVNFELKMQRVLPNGRFMPLDHASEPVFSAFFDLDIKKMEMQDPKTGSGSTFLGIYEGNDPTKRLMVAANYNNDIGDYWQWSAEGTMPIPVTNEAYKLGVNYIMYGFTY